MTLLLLLACPKPQQVDTGEDSATDTQLVETEIFEGEAPCRSPIEVQVQEVYDGDTISVSHGSVYEVVRFIGIDTPEMNWGNAPDCWAAEALDRSTGLLLNQSIWLGFDAECKDDYDRTLAYLSLDGAFINRQLVREGHGWAFPFEPNTAFASSLQTAEQQARAEDAGLWESCWD